MLLLLLRTPTALATRPEARCPSCEMGDLQLGAEKFFEVRHGSGGTLQTEKLSPWPPLTSPPKKPARQRQENGANPPEHWENWAIPLRGWEHREDGDTVSTRPLGQEICRQGAFVCPPSRTCTGTPDWSDLGAAASPLRSQPRPEEG